MQRTYNFSAGPAGLPTDLLKTAQSEFLSYNNLGCAAFEVSHRSKEFMAISQRATDLLVEGLNIPDDFSVLFLGGGATMQSAAMPMNLLGQKKSLAFAITGHWSKRSELEARRYCHTNIVADTTNDGHTTIPDIIDCDSDNGYLHYADNETVHGVEFTAPPAVAVPLVADMSSNILTRPIDFTPFAAVYAGAQKNIAPAGLTIVIVRRSLISPMAITPSVFNFLAQIENDSMLNTPPTFQIYMVQLMLQWVKAQGGITAMQARAEQRATLLYEYLDNSDYYRPAVSNPHYRSRINVPFFLNKDEHTATFVAEAEKKGIIGIKGHRAIGGIRASMYNAMPIAGVHQLIAHCTEFAKKYG